MGLLPLQISERIVLSKHTYFSILNYSISES